MLSKIEMRLTDLGIGGKICRMSPLKNIQGLIQDEIRFGVKTIVVVGNDETVASVVNNITNYNMITLGIIPIGEKNRIARALGIFNEMNACDILAARKIEKIDLGKINNIYFISGIRITAENSIDLYFEDKYHIISQTHYCDINICNLQPTFFEDREKKLCNPKDGFLEALIQPVQEMSESFFGFLKKGLKKGKNKIKESIIPFKKIYVQSQKSVTVTTDGHKILKPPVQIEVVPKKLRVIVGRKQVSF